MDAELTEIADWLAKQLRKCQGNSLGWLIKGGAYLVETRCELEPGEWGKLFASGRLPFGLRTAQMLARIAENPALRKPENLQWLPSALVALDELAHLDPAVIEQAIREREIRPEMTAAEAKAFARRQRP